MYEIKDDEKSLRIELTLNITSLFIIYLLIKFKNFKIKFLYTNFKKGLLIIKFVFLFTTNFFFELSILNFFFKHSPYMGETCCLERCC